MTSQGGAARPRLDRPARRESIVAGAASAFAVGGHAATSMADVAAAVGVSHLIVYRHFESKDELYETVVRRAVDHLADALATESAVGTYGPTPAALLEVARADPDAFRVLWRHASREPQFHHHADMARDQLGGAAAEALGAMVDAEFLPWAARATVGYLVEAVLVWVEDGDEALDARFAGATEAALRAGVRSWAKGAPARPGREGATRGR